MQKLDGYILTSLLGPFGFFALVFAGVIWLTQALGLIDRVIADNQSALVFLEFSTLILPRVLSMVLPLAAFGATLYAVNRLYAESELTVILAAGRSYFRLLVPFVIFGAFVALLMLLVTLYLNPVSSARLAQRMFDIRGEITNSFVGEGEFVHPSEGITLYVGDTSRQGEMAEIFLNDQRDAKQTVTYSAQKALLLHDNSSTRMVMFDGIAQTLDKTNDTLTSIKFSQFVYDLSELIAVRGQRTRSPAEYFLPALLNPTVEMLGTAHYARGDFEAQAHDQLAIPLLTLAFPSLALASILSGPFRRGGIALRLAVAVFGAAVIQLGTVLAKSFVRANPDFALVSYLPAIVAALVAAFLLLRAGSSRQLLRKLSGQT